jgi:hypothetical protein
VKTNVVPLAQMSSSSEFDILQFARNTLIQSHRTTKDIARRTGLCPSTITRLRDDVTKRPQLGTVRVLLKELGYELTVRRR